MISVPTSTSPQSASAPQIPMPSEEFLMMAAAQMHSEGRLIIPDTVRSTDDQAPSNKAPPREYQTPSGDTVMIG